LLFEGDKAMSDVPNMPNLPKIDIMKIQKTLSELKDSNSFNLIERYHAWEQEAQTNKESVLWNPQFREHIVTAFNNDVDVSAIVEKLYLEVLSELYDAQEAIRDKIRKATSSLLDQVNSKLGV
jgi:hypothetical protein